MIFIYLCVDYVCTGVVKAEGGASFIRRMRSEGSVIAFGECFKMFSSSLPSV